jgi:hypothetical protein
MRDDEDATPFLVRNLRDIFGSRLRGLIAYGEAAPGAVRRAAPLHTLAHVDSLTLDDLRRCAAMADRWTARRLATPLFAVGDEFARSLDTFPLEYGAILADYRPIFGRNPFDGLRVRDEDVRRACEIQAKSLLLHLREGYVESGGRDTEVAALIAASAAPFRTLLEHVARLEGQNPADTDALVRFAESLRLSPDAVRPLLAIVDLDDLGPIEAERLFPIYLEAADHLARFLDTWTGGR